MRKRLSSAIILLLIMLLCSELLAVPSFAAEMPDGALPVTVKLEGAVLPEPEETYLIRLKADYSAYPMPAGSVNGVYSLFITGAATASFPAINFSLVGVYTYTLYQEAGDNEQAIYDDTVYLLTVYVTNDEHGGNELKTQWVLRRDGADAKQDALFTNYYESVLPVSPPLIEVEKRVQEKKFTKTGDLLHYSFVIKNVGLAAIVKLEINDSKLGIKNMIVDRTSSPFMPGESNNNLIPLILLPGGVTLIAAALYLIWKRKDSVPD
ncbi:MAG: hypothetical protein GX763_01215 [Clostridiaceae bacterium]|nr:hypothetical protein [Clostridiaceae bacterium]